MDLGPFFGAPAGDWFVARTGYTGEDGWEIMLPTGEAAGFWERLRQAGVMPCGLGARDTLRLEAGMNLYGSDMDETVSPLECGLAWTIAWEPQDRDFIGRAALVEQKARGVAAQAGRPGARRPGRAALAPEGDRAGRGRGRGHERHVLPDARALDRARAGPVADDRSL